MSETALNFGPDWIRALATGSTSTPCPMSMTIPRYSLAEFRYGREEMLALIPKDVKVPGCLKHFPHLVRENFQIPLALTPVTEEEQRLAARSVNSEAALRASGKTGPGYGGMTRPGRGGGSVDRGRGRGRGGYYQRGLMHDDSEDIPGFSRPRTLERSSSATEKDHRWDERDRRYDRPFSSGRGGYDDTNLKHDNMRGPNEHWRKYDKEDEGGWRTAGSRSFDKSGGRNSWRNNSEQRKDVSDRNSQSRNNVGDTKGGVGSQPTQSSPGAWMDVPAGNLPEWSVEETVEPDAVGTFDSSGAFLETKVSEDTSYTEVYASDDADDGLSKEGSPEANKEALNKSPPKKTPSSSSKQSANKKNSKPFSEDTSPEGTPVKNNPELPKSNSKNSSKGQTSKNVETVIKQNSTVEKQQHQVKKEPDLVSTVQQHGAVKSSKIESVILDNVRNSQKVVTTPGAVIEDDAFAYHKKATEHMVAQWTEEIEQKAPPSEVHAKQEKDTKWFYQDPQGETQGPFTSPEMLDWFSAGYFTMGLMVRRTSDETYSQLGDLIKSWGQVPFMPGSSSPPPNKVKPSSSVAPQPIVPEPMLAAASVPLPKQDEQLLALQQQLFQQQLMQQQLMLRQAQMQQFLSQLKQQDNFASLNTQQQQLIMQQYMAQMPRPDSKPMSGQPNILNPVPPLSLPLLGLPLPSMMKNDLARWPAAPDTGMWSANLPTQPPGGSLWDVDVTKTTTEEAELERQKKLAEEHENKKKVVEEQLRLQQEKELEENRQQEESRKRHEDEERKRKEEIKRQEEERKRLEEIRQREEQRRKEEKEQQRREELQRLEEQRKQQEELKKQEELRKVEENRIQELKRKEEQARQEELKKQQDLRKQEERRKKEEQKRIQMEKEQEKFQEIETQKEALRRKEMEREERLKREREEAELRKLAELKLSCQGPVWGMQNKQSNTQHSLADIQRLQEEKEREEKEEKMRQQLLQQQFVKTVQQNKNGLTWAKRANDSQPVVKSLSEIQQEEARQIAQQNRMQKPQNPPPAVNYNAGVWGNSSHLNKITAVPSGWNANTIPTGGFWEEALHTTQVRKQPPKASNTESAFPALIIPAQPAAISSHKNKSNRAKKDEDAVARIFGSHHKPTDEFTKWCTDAISAMPSSVDVPTFIAFLKDIESPFEVYDYVKSYFGEGKEPKEFAKLFLEKRSKYRNQAKQILDEDNLLWGPAPAITPTKKTVVPTTNENDGNSNTKGKTKKRKGKMQKLDNSMLGFTVQPNPERLNAAGEIERIENM